MTSLGDRVRLRTLGPRLVLDSVPWECLEIPGFRALCRAVALEAPRTVGGVVVVTSTHRAAGPGDRFSWHFAGRAIDWRTGISTASSGELRLDRRRGSIVAASPTEALEIGRAWRDRVARRLGPEFDVLLGDPNHIDHGHGEHDGAKASRVFQRRPEP